MKNTLLQKMPFLLHKSIFKKLKTLSNFYKILCYIGTIGIDKLIWTIETVEIEYGHNLSFQKKLPINKDGEPLPWYTYPAIEYLNQLEFKDQDVFEYGTGNSSLFWSQKARNITSVEDCEEWYKLIKENSRTNQKMILLENKTDYVNYIFSNQIEYDIIIIDGNHRLDCAKVAVQCLKTGGIIILDNSDWYPQTAKFLHDSDLIQVDFTGIGPINDYTWTTSIFFHRKFAMKSSFEFQPQPGIGSISQIANPE